MELQSYLECAKECIEAIQKMPPRMFNNQQCDYLAHKLEVVVEGARSFLGVFPSKCHEHEVLAEDKARYVEILKLLVAVANQIESFIQGCSKEEWIQAAMTLTNVSEYVSSLGFNLELCKVALNTHRCAPGEILRLDQVSDMHRKEVEIVRSKASVDWDSIVEKLLQKLTQKTLKDEDNDLACYLLQRLHRVKPIPHSAASRSFWKHNIGEEGSVLSKLLKWVKSDVRLGKGATGTVYRAMWLGTPVAKKSFPGKGNEHFKREVEILAGLCHSNVTSMFCCGEDKRTSSIIMELMDEDLHDMMERRCGECETPFTNLEAVDIMLQVSEGVNYIHQPSDVKPSIVHRDLKSSNILIKRVSPSDLESGYVHVKVTDFGLSKTKEYCTRYTQQTLNMGTSQWMAPEVINLQPGSEESSSEGTAKYPHKSDVYSFGILCYEILTGGLPFTDILANEAKKMVLEGLRPNLPDHCPPKLKTLIEQCWHQDPTKRPSFGVVCAELKYLKYLLMMGFSSDQDKQLSKEPLQEPGVKQISDMCAEPMEGTSVMLLQGNEVIYAGVTILGGHTDWVNCCAWSQSGSLLASGSLDRTVRVWSISDGLSLNSASDLRRLSQDFGSTPSTLSTTALVLNHDGVLALDWNEKGTLLATGSWDGVVRIWSKDGDLRNTLSKCGNLKGPLKWNKRGDCLLGTELSFDIEPFDIEHYEASYVTIIWDTKTGDVKDKFAVDCSGGHGPSRGDVEWRDNVSFATCYGCKQIYVWKCGDANPLKVFESDKEIRTIKWDPSGTLLASGCYDHTTKIWRLEQDECLHNLKGHMGPVDCINWSPSGPGSANPNQDLVLASGSKDGTIKVWDVERGSVLFTCTPDGEHVRDVAFSPNGKYLAGASWDTNCIRIWSVKDGSLVRTYRGSEHNYKFCWNREGDKLAAYSWTSSSVFVLDLWL